MTQADRAAGADRSIRVLFEGGASSTEPPLNCDFTSRAVFSLSIRSLFALNSRGVVRFSAKDDFAPLDEAFLRVVANDLHEESGFDPKVGDARGRRTSHPARLCSKRSTSSATPTP